MTIILLIIYGIGAYLRYASLTEDSRNNLNDYYKYGYSMFWPIHMFNMTRKQDL